MRIIDAKCNISLPLGRLGENEYTCIRFDVSKWLTEMPTAVIALYNQRPQDADAYPVDGITVRDGIVTWTVTSAELAQVGKGRCELVAIENEVVAKSAFYDTVIFDALGGNGEAPEPWVSWQQTFAQMKADAEAAAQSAEEAVEHYPRITDGIWQVWDVQTGAWVSTGVHAQGERGPQGEKGEKGDDALCVYLETPTVAIPCDADGNTKPLNQIVAVGYVAFRGGKRIAASSEYAGYTYANPKQMIPYEIYGFEINPATATSSGVIGFRITEGVNPFGVVEAEIANPTIGITVEGSTMGLPLQFVRVRDGEQGERGPHGEKGTDGVSPSVTVTDITDGHRVTITDAEHPQGISFDVMNGETPEAPVQDVQVNGTSVLNDGVANVPVAGPNRLGVVQLDVGFAISSQGLLLLTNPAGGEIKAGTNYKKAIVPSVQDQSAFYGLAKAAGDSTQSASSNPVGTYTDEAKAAIQQMLDVPSNDDIPDVPVQDVQVNGTSVVSDGVANVPVASASEIGAVGINSSGGIDINSSTGKLRTSAANGSQVRIGTDSYKPIVPNNQHNATFYGLAKAAGDTTQSASSNAVGTYTENAKSAIQTMLGLSAIIGTVEGATASKPYAIGQPFLHGGELYKATAAIAANDAIVPGTNCEQTTIIDLITGV